MGRSVGPFSVMVVEGCWAIGMDIICVCVCVCECECERERVRVEGGREGGV